MFTVAYICHHYHYICRMMFLKYITFSFTCFKCGKKKIFFFHLFSFIENWKWIQMNICVCVCVKKNEFNWIPTQKKKEKKMENCQNQTFKYSAHCWSLSIFFLVENEFYSLNSVHVCVWVWWIIVSNFNENFIFWNLYEKLFYFFLLFNFSNLYFVLKLDFFPLTNWFLVKQMNWKAEKKNFLLICHLFSFRLEFFLNKNLQNLIFCNNL